jgi:hypothetical protein
MSRAVVCTNPTPGEVMQDKKRFFTFRMRWFSAVVWAHQLRFAQLDACE